MAAQQLIASRFAVSGVPVFMYHDLCVSPTTEERYTTPLRIFREHLAFLREQQFAVRPICEFAAGLSERKVVLTFDDGLASHYDLALPALLEEQLSATFFVTTGLIDSPGYLTWKQLREMSAAGMTIGSHGHRHIDHTGLALHVAQSDLLRSRTELEDHLGTRATTFSAPYGFLNNALTLAARKAGFLHICSSQPWLATPEEELISRLAVYCDTSLAEFRALATRCAWPLIARRTRNAVLHLPKQILLRTSPRKLGVNVGEETK
jgi:peptidoglycan/xylan/chitin deacetylase (PgdA/CDA1 family)